MISGVENAIPSIKIAHSAAGATQNKEVQKVVPTQPKIMKTERSSSEEQEMPAKQAKSMVDSMNNFLVSADSNLKFVFHEELNEYYVTIIDSQTDEVIREIPPKKLLDIHAAMREFVGLLVDRKI